MIMKITMPVSTFPMAPLTSLSPRFARARAKIASVFPASLRQQAAKGGVNEALRVFHVKMLQPPEL